MLPGEYIRIRLLTECVRRFEDTHMKDLFTFQNLPMAIIIGLIVFAWLSFLSVIFLG